MRFVGIAALAGSATALVKPVKPIGPNLHVPAGASFAVDAAPGHGKLEHFDQLIDHSNPSLGTFKQRYWWNADHYAGPHSPISLESPSESAVGTNGDLSHMDNRTLPGLLAQDNQGAYIIIEHRYWGGSSPVQGDLDTENLQYLTLDNSIQDLIYFAKNVVFPFDKTNGTATKPDQAPWLLSGCSYSGALSAWTHALAPGTFWAHEAGSAVVQTVEQFWEYYAPIKNIMTQNCTADLQRIVKHTDDVLLKGSDSDKKALKDKFGWGSYDDKTFAGSITSWISIQQGQQVYEQTRQLDDICDYVENQRPTATVPKPGPDGVGLDLALDGLARGLQAAFGNNQAQDSTDGGLVQDPWYWFLCNEPFEWWQSWGRLDTTGLLSRVYSWKDDIQEVCVQEFPDKNGHQYGLKGARTYHTVNKHTGGWRNVNTTRLLWINGEFDPWRPATVSWEGRPGGALQSTPEAPVFVIKGAGHCNDYVTKNAETPQGKPIFDATLAQFRTWVADFYKQHPHLG